MNFTRLFMPVFANRGFSLLILLFMLTGCQTLPNAPEYVAAGDYDSVTTYLSERIPVEMKRHSVKGLSIALVNEEGVLWAAGFGMADVNQQIKASSDLEEILLGLSVTDYCQGPKPDRDRPGNLWIFGREIEGHEVYIKLKVAQVGDKRIAKCISFHIAKFPLKYPHR